jgi:hypothetical protein
MQLFFISYTISFLICTLMILYSFKFTERSHMRERSRLFGKYIRENISNKFRLAIDKIFSPFFMRQLLVIIDIICGFMEGIEGYEQLIIFSKNIDKPNNLDNKINIENNNNNHLDNKPNKLIDNNSIDNKSLDSIDNSMDIKSDKLIDNKSIDNISDKFDHRSLNKSNDESLDKLDISDNSIDNKSEKLIDDKSLDKLHKSLNKSNDDKLDNISEDKLIDDKSLNKLNDNIYITQDKLIYDEKSLDKLIDKLDEKSISDEKFNIKDSFDKNNNIDMISLSNSSTSSKYINISPTDELVSKNITPAENEVTINNIPVNIKSDDDDKFIRQSLILNNIKKKEVKQENTVSIDLSDDENGVNNDEDDDILDKYSIDDRTNIFLETSEPIIKQKNNKINEKITNKTKTSIERKGKKLQISIKRN